jgi:tRNA(Ile)-lysidine synthase TilS/MesJ
MGTEKVICKKCILHSKVPEVTIGNDGLCVFCQISNHITPVMVQQNAALLESRMLSIFENVKKQKRAFDVLVYFSGGKDSTYVLNLMKNKYKMNVLAYSMIQPFVTDVAKKNMEEIVKKLNVHAIKFFIQENVFNRGMAYSLEHGHDYGLTEWVGCQICGYFTKWVGVKLAMKLGIPLVIDGMDSAQGGFGVINEGEQVKLRMRNGIKPFGRVHDLINDALGEEYKDSIYNYNQEELLKSEYPTAMSPLCFVEYDPSYSFHALEELGISFKQFKSLNTNCELLYLLDYISMCRYDCDSYIKLYASGLRNNYDTIEQLELDQAAHKKQLTREEMIRLLDEYRDVLFYVMDHGLDESTINDGHRASMMDLAKFSRSMFGEETMGKLAFRVLKMKGQAEFLGIDLRRIPREGEGGSNKKTDVTQIY